MKSKHLLIAAYILSFSVNATWAYELPACTPGGSCEYVPPDVAERLRQINSAADLSSTANGYKDGLFSLGYSFGQDLILASDDQQASINRCFVSEPDIQSSIRCVLSLSDLPPEIRRSAEGIRTAEAILAVALGTCARERAAGCPSFTDARQAQNQLAARATAGYAAILRGDNSQEGARSGTGSARGSQRPRAAAQTGRQSGRQTSRQAAAQSPVNALQGENTAPFCPYVDVQCATCSGSHSTQLGSSVARSSSVLSSSSADVIFDGRIAASMADGAGSEITGVNPTHMLNNLAAKHLVRGIVDHIKRQMEMPYIGERIRAFLPQIIARCTTRGPYSEPLQELQSYVQSTQAASSGSRSAYMARVRGSATALRRLDEESAAIMRDYVGANTSGSDVSSAINRLSGGMQNLESDWNDGYSGLVPCRSALTSMRLMTQSIGQATDSRSQCEQLFGQTIANRNSNVDARAVQVIRCGGASQVDSCVSSCRNADGSTPSRGDSLVVCTQARELSADYLAARGRGYDITSNNIIYRGSLSQRCNEKEARLAQIATERSRLLAEHPELGRVVEVNGSRVAAYEHVRGAPESWPRSVQSEVGINGPQSLVGPGGLGDYLGQICSDPAKAAQLVYNDRGLMRDFMTCGGRHGMPVVRGSEGGSTPDCRFIRRNAHMLCGLQNQAARSSANQETDHRMAALFGDIMDTAGCVGMFQAAGSLVESAVTRVGQQTLNLSGVTALREGSSAIGSTLSEAAVSMAQQTINPVSALTMTGFTYYGSEAVRGAQIQASETLASSYASCLGGNRSGCSSLGSARQAYESALQQEWTQIASYTVLGALIPGGRFTPEELAEASSLVRNLRSRYDRALRRGASARVLENDLNRLREAEGQLQQLAREKFPEHIEYTDPQTNASRRIPRESLSVDDIMAIDSVSRSPRGSTPADRRLAARQNPGESVLPSPQVRTNRDAVMYGGDGSPPQHIQYIDGSGVRTVDGVRLSPNSAAGRRGGLEVVTGTEISIPGPNGQRITGRATVDARGQITVRANGQDIVVPPSQYDSIRSDALASFLGTPVGYERRGSAAVSPPPARSVAQSATPSTPPDRVLAARNNPGESVLPNPQVRSVRDAIVFEGDGVPAEHIQYIDRSSGVRTHDGIRLRANSAVGRTGFLEVVTGTEISIPGPNGQRITGRATVDALGQITVRANGQDIVVPPSQYNSILPAGPEAFMGAPVGYERRGGAAVVPPPVRSAPQSASAPTPADRRLAARQNPGESVLPNPRVVTRTDVISYDVEGAPVHHVQYINDSGVRTRDGIRFPRNAAVGRTRGFEVTSGTEISIPGPNGQRITGRATVDARGQITVRANGQDIVVPPSQYNSILPAVSR